MKALSPCLPPRMDARAAPDVLSFARVRNDASAAPFLRYGGDGSVSLGGGATLRGQTFSFHDVFEGSARGTQAAVFEAVGTSAVRRMAGGENVALVAQGQALSGKRWTLLGDLDAEANHGLVPRAIARLFALAARPDGGGLEAECEVRLSWVEVCQERLFDLLRPGSDELQLGESAARGAHAEGLAEPSVDSVEKALGLLRTGVTCGRHGMSHTVLTVLLRQRRQDGSTRVSTLTAVECAPPGVQQAQQASAALAEVVRSGGDAAAHRGSKLTRLLEKPGVLGGNCATSFFACCSPAKEHKEATAAAFKFAAEAMTLPNSARVNDFGIVEELAEHAACLTADEAALRQHARNLEDILAQLGIKAGGLASGKSFSKFSSLKRVAELDFRAADKQAEKTAVSRFDPQQVLRLSSECERLLHAKQQGEADLGNLESELAAAKSTAAGLMMDTVELREAIDSQRQAAPPLIEELRELRALHGASSAEPGAGGVAQHGNIELLQLEAQAAELRRRAKATRTALAAAKAREHELAPKLVPPAGADRIYRPVDVSAQPPSAAAVAAAQEAARQQLRLVAPPASTSSAASGQGGSDDAGFTFELLEATFGCRQPEVQAASPPVAPEGMTQTDGTVLETIDVRDADFIRSEIEASNEDLRLVQGGMEISPEWRTVLASESLAYGSMVNIVGAGVPHHVRGAYWIKILETCGCPPPASLDRYVELASAPPSAEAAGGWRDDSPLAVVDRMFGSDRMADRQNRALHRVLRSYAQIDPTLKYCEAIGLVAGLCLKILPEYQAFRLLSALLLGEGRGDEPYLGPPGAARSPGLGLRGLYAEGFPLLECLQRQFNTLLRRLAGGLVLAYEGKQFNLKQLCAPWLFTLFTSSFPAKVGMRIWDHLVLQLLPQFGSADRTTPSCAVLSIACVALIKQHREELMRWDVGSASEFHNEIGMLLAERAMADAYFGQHLIPLAQDRQTTDSLRAEKSSFDKVRHLPAFFRTAPVVCQQPTFVVSCRNARRLLLSCASP